MQEVGAAFRRANVAAIYLVHGTFVGPDALGLVREIARISHRAAAPVRRWLKQAMDAIAKDAGNYTQDYSAQFEHSSTSANTCLDTRSTRG